MQVDLDEVRAKYSEAKRRVESLTLQLEEAQIAADRLMTAIEVLDEINGSDSSAEEKISRAKRGSVPKLILRLLAESGGRLSVVDLAAQLASVGHANSKTASGVLSRMVKQGSVFSPERGVYALRNETTGEGEKQTAP